MITHQRQNNAGFSLIELSVVMVIVSILLVGVLQAYRIYDEKSKIERMNILMTTLDQNIMSFLKKEGRLPCPAPVDGAAAGNNFDSESCSGATNVAGTSGGRVLIGKIPAASLGLSNDYMRDTYGSYITYAVTEAATTSASGVVGAIRVREENIDRTAGSSTFGELVELENHTNVAYLFVSAGRTKAGAFTHEGTRLNCSTNTKDGENCNANGVFLASLLSEADVASFYDDKLVFKGDNELGSSSIALRRADEGADYVRERGQDSGGIPYIRYTIRKPGYLEMTDNVSGDVSGVQLLQRNVQPGVGMMNLDTGDVVDFYDGQAMGRITLRPAATYINGEEVSPASATVRENFVFLNKYSRGEPPDYTGGLSYRWNQGSSQDGGSDHYEASHVRTGTIWIK